MSSEVFFTGPFGIIEGKYHINPNPHAPVALVFHPDPRQGGTMNNKVNYTLFKSFVNTGFTTLRINFPGVGKSAGISDGKYSELEAASVALDWLQHENPQASHFWLGGFSFGSWIAIHLTMRRPEVSGFVLIAPPVNNPKYDFGIVDPCPTPGLIISAEQDTIAPAKDIENFVANLRKQDRFEVEYYNIENTDHMFGNQLDQISSICEDYINTTLAIGVKKPVRKKRRRRKKRDKSIDHETDYED